MSADAGPKLKTAQGEDELNESDQAPWQEFMVRLLGASSLGVLAGSGTSFGLAGLGPCKRAPMMSDLLLLVKRLPAYHGLIRKYSNLANESNVEELLSKTQAAAQLASPPGVEEDFINAASAVIREACDFVDNATDLSAHEMILRKLTPRSPRQERLQLFTTNYDLAFEIACQHLNFTAIDGFGYGSRSIFNGRNFDFDLVKRGDRGDLQLSPNVFRLMKLHGSVDWDDRSGEIVRAPRPKNPVLIYPSTDKYRQSYRQPFSESMSRFQAFLRQAEVSLIVVGFGFNDDHLSHPIIDVILSNPMLNLLAVGPSVLTDPGDTFSRLRRATEEGDRRIALLQTDFAGLAALLPDRRQVDDWEKRQKSLSGIWRDEK